MSGINFRIDVVNNELLPFLAEARDLLSPANIEVLMDEMAQALESDVIERFNTSQAPDGSTWVESESARLEGRKTLVKNNILGSGWTHEHDASGFVMGTPEVYGAIHHYGGETGRNHATVLPARPILGIEQTQQALLDQVWLGWVA